MVYFIDIIRSNSCIFYLPAEKVLPPGPDRCGVCQTEEVFVFYDRSFKMQLTG